MAPKRDATRVTKTEAVTTADQANNEIFEITGGVAAAASRDHAMTWAFFRITWNRGHGGSVRVPTR